MCSKIFDDATNDGLLFSSELSWSLETLLTKEKSYRENKPNDCRDWK